MRERRDGAGDVGEGLRLHRHQDLRGAGRDRGVGAHVAAEAVELGPLAGVDLGDRDLAGSEHAPLEHPAQDRLAHVAAADQEYFRVPSHEC